MKRAKQPLAVSLPQIPLSKEACRRVEEQKEIGKRIKYIRVLILEKSQKELAETLGVNQCIISRIETGRTKPSLSLLLALSRLSGKSVDWIMKGE